ncbi:hypothetical protein RIF29_15739 [Crotalaria pallida]|uniref:Uncharacterized protein n=1 Tax=Crotalaria pallida TaxID=3830 RepID=A0AAN9IBF3_CROPI
MHVHKLHLPYSPPSIWSLATSDFFVNGVMGVAMAGLRWGWEWWQCKVKEGLILEDRVNASELHPIVATTSTKEQKDKAPQQEEWQTVQTRSSKRLQKKKKESNQGLEVGGTSTSTSGNG